MFVVHLALKNLSVLMWNVKSILIGNNKIIE